MQFFMHMSSGLIAALLHAASVMNADFARVQRWMLRINDQQTHQEVDAILHWSKSVEALDQWVSFIAREPNMMGDIAATAESLLLQASAQGLMLGDRAVIYRAGDLTARSSVGRFQRSEDVRQILDVWSQLSDSRGQRVLARDARSFSWGIAEPWRDSLRMLTEAAFFEMAVEQVEDQVDAGSRELRAQIVQSGSLIDDRLVQMGGRRRLVPTLMVFGPGEQDLRDQMLIALADSADKRSTILMLDLTGEELREDAAVTHVLVDGGCVPAVSRRLVNWQDPAGWISLREEEAARQLLREQQAKEQAMQGLQASDETTQPAGLEQQPPISEMPRPYDSCSIANLTIATVELNDFGRERVQHLLAGSKAERTPLTLLALIAVQIRQHDHDSSPGHLAISPQAGLIGAAQSEQAFTPLVLVGDQRTGIELLLRHQPSVDAVAALTRERVDAVAWAHVPEGAPASGPVREAYATWTQAAADGRRQIGEVLVWDVDVSDLTDDLVEPIRVIVPTGQGLPR